jgi:hypothetical protein
MFFLRYILFFLLANIYAGTARGQIFKKAKKHSILPFIGMANNACTEFTMQVSPDLQVRLFNGDAARLPAGIRYEYRMKHGNRLGADLMLNFNPMMMQPQFRLLGGDFTGPMVINHKGSMLGFFLHAGKAVDIKLIEFFASAGVGSYLQMGASRKLTRDYSWYRGAPADFYPFATAVTHGVIRTFMPTGLFNLGVRFKHIEFGMNNQLSLLGPVKNFRFDGITHRHNIRFRSIGYYVGYRYEF